MATTKQNGTSNTPQKKQQELPAQQQKFKTVYNLLKQSRDQIKMALPRHITPDRFLRVVLTSLRKNPLLIECEEKSLLAAIMESAQLGLEPDGILGHAYLVPYRNNKLGVYEAQLQIGYRGYIDLARRSGQVQSIQAHIVYENDEFEIQYGLEEKLVHVPARGDRGEPIGVYAIARFKDGSHHFEFLWAEDVERIRKMSKVPDSGAWKDHWEAMWRKTAIRQLAKYLPLSVEMTRAAVLDEYAEAGLQREYIDDGLPEIAPGSEVSQKTKEKITALKDKLKKDQQSEPEPIETLQVICPEGGPHAGLLVGKEECDKCNARKGCPAWD